MKTAHTPGPWTYEELFACDNDSLGISIQSGRNELAHISGIGQEDFDNVRLIAAAPDLLEALMVLLPVASSAYGALSKDLDQARAAISKATGETA